MPNIPFHLPLMARTGQVQDSSTVQQAFEPVKKFSSREGVVELAKSKRSGQLRIIKSVRHISWHEPPNEAKMLSQLDQVHPNIVRLYAAELNARIGFSLMCFEYCSGADLFDQVQRFEQHGVSLPPLFALHCVVSIAEGLSFIHSGHVYSESRGTYERTCTNGIIHRDIKSDNCYLRFPGKIAGLPDVVVADFGLSCSPADAHPGCGCIPYMSPECRYGSSRITHKTDIYSFGVMFHEILANSSKTWPMHKDPKKAVVSRTYAGLGFSELLQSCLAIKPKDRGNFSGFTGSGMLNEILRFRQERDRKARNESKVDERHWVARKNW